jgi:hypothetical protein
MNEIIELRQFYQITFLLEIVVIEARLMCGNRGQGS